MKLAAALAVAAVAAVAACSSGSPAASPTGAQTLPALPTAQQVAGMLHLTGFVDCPGNGSVAGVSDAGTAWRGTERIGIDTFPSPDVRDGWKKVSANFGIVTRWQGATWVAYKAVDQATGNDC